MKIFRMIVDHYSGARLYCAGVQYSAPDAEADVLVALEVAAIELVED